MDRIGASTMQELDFDKKSQKKLRKYVMNVFLKKNECGPARLKSGQQPVYTRQLPVDTSI